MNKHAVLIGLSTILLTTSIAAAQTDQSIPGVKPPDPKAPIASWTPVQQYQTRYTPWDYGGWDGALVLADELGDRQSHLGRASILHHCFRSTEVREHVAQWALCRTDFLALDLKKAEAEMVAAGVSADEREYTMNNITKNYEMAKAIVERLDEEAKRDKGLQKLLTDVEAAKKEWADYAVSHRAELELYFKLRDAVRTGKLSDPAFDGCDAVTRPRFEKVVRSVAKTIPWDTDSLGGYAYYVLDAPDGYITTVSWAACAWSVHPSMEAMYAEASTRQAALVRHGWRTFAMGKLGADGYKPRFADTSYYLGSVGQTYISPGGTTMGRNAGAPSYGEVKKLTKQDDEIRIAFALGEVDACLRWETRHGEKYCAERGNVLDSQSDRVVPAAYAAALKVKVSVVVQAGVPVCVYDSKKKKVLAIFGVALK